MNGLIKSSSNWTSHIIKNTNHYKTSFDSVKMEKIILASSSPRRKDLLASLGLKFEVVPSNVVEDFSNWDKLSDLTMRLARQKAESVAPSYRDALIIGADTLVYRPDAREIMGKPVNEEDARRMLKALSGQWHAVMTGLHFLKTNNGRGETNWSDSWLTRVKFRELTDKKIDWYIATGEPFGKAGAYAIQGQGMALIREVQWDLSNVMGLPLDTVKKGLDVFGIQY
jgi:septum formation protein